MAKQKINTQQGFNAPPRIEGQLVSINRYCLLFKSYLNNGDASFGWLLCLSYWIIFLPLYVLTILVYLDDIIQNPSALVIFLYASMGIFYFGMSIGAAWIQAKFIRKSSNVLFNRQSQTVEMVSMGYYYRADWDSVKAYLGVNTEVAGFLPVSRTVLTFELHLVKDHPMNKEHPIHKGSTKFNTTIKALVPVNVWGGDGGHDAEETTFEYIRQFMQNGVKSVPIPREPELPLESKSLGKTLPFKPALQYFWPFPMYKPEDGPTMRKFKILMLPVRIVLTVPNALAEATWHFIINRKSDKYQLPNYDKIQEHAITLDMVRKALPFEQKETTYVEMAKHYFINKKTL